MSGKKSLMSISTNSGFDNDVMEKFRVLIKSSKKSLREIFEEADKDKSGRLSAMEMRNLIRKMNLAITSREIDQLIEKFNPSGDGIINWEEFEAKFKTKDKEQRAAQRSFLKLT
jgi:Ca2+-binding EF-hand superfamily protein